MAEQKKISPWWLLPLGGGAVAGAYGLQQMAPGWGNIEQQPWYKMMGGAPEDWGGYYDYGLQRIQEQFEPQAAGAQQRMIQQGLWGSGPEKEVFGRLGQAQARATGDFIAQIAREQMLMAHQRQMQRAQMGMQWQMGERGAQQDWWNTMLGGIGELGGAVGSLLPFL